MKFKLLILKLLLTILQTNMDIYDATTHTKYSHYNENKLLREVDDFIFNMKNKEASDEN